MFNSIYVIATIKGRIQSFIVYLRLYYMHGTKCGIKIKELLRNVWYNNLIIGGQKIRNFWNWALSLVPYEKRRVLATRIAQNVCELGFFILDCLK